MKQPDSVEQTLGTTSYALQDGLLPGVSRTFALTIPQLPPGLREAVTNAYLLCRIADTIEDDPGLEQDEKRRFHQRFVAIVEGREEPWAFSRDLAGRLTGGTPANERDLVAGIPGVVAITHRLEPGQRAAVERCVRTMSRGMLEFQATSSLAGVETVSDMARYCYFVAGVVGEMLTDLFCRYSDAIAARREALMARAVSFGQGLQLTNILKDFWEDRDRESCWLPREIFRAHGVELAQLDAQRPPEGFRKGILDLVGIAHACLQDAMEFVLLIPRREVGIRRFCLWAIGLAILTLQKIRRHPDYRSAAEVKVSRRTVRLTLLATTLAARSRWALRLMFRIAGAGLPEAPRNVGRFDAASPEDHSEMNR